MAIDPEASMAISLPTDHQRFPGERNHDAGQNGSGEGDSYLVLVVDDDNVASQLLSAVLGTLGHRVVTAATGHEALVAVATHAPDLVLLDLGLPDMTGFDVAVAIRERNPQARLPIVFVSGEQDPAERVKGFDAGGSDFVTKPYDISEIKSRIAHQLEILGLRRQLEDSAEVLEARVAERTAELRVLTETDPASGRFNERGLVRYLKPWRQQQTDRLLLAVEIVQWETFTSWLGHIEAGAILQSFGERLATIPGCGPIGRFGASVFVVAVSDTNHGLESLESLRSTLQEPLAVGSRIIKINVAMGAIADTSLDRSETALLQEANLALLGAKRKSRPFDLLTDERKAELAEELVLEQDLWSDGLSEQLLLHYQPLFDATGAIHSFEALVRWRHPDRGLISPGVFIPIAERSGSIEVIGWWTIEEAMRQLVSWRADGLVEDDLHMAVNLSSVQAAGPSLPGRIAKLLQNSGLAASSLELELTETAILGQNELVQGVLSELQAQGVSIALDDFGTGASSLQLLQEMPADVVKIDRSFVARMDAEADSRAIVAATIRLAHDLGKRVVAEGIEQETEFELLRSMDCDFYQGFLFSRPLEPARMASLMAGRAAQRPS